MKPCMRLFAATVIGSTLAWSAQAATLDASYLFDGSLLATETGAPALLAVDPLGLGEFTTGTVFGQTRTVYRFGGTTTNQGGLAVSTVALLSRTQYSVEMVFDFDATSRFRRVLDTANRSTDYGLYVDTNDKLTTWTGVNNPGGLVADDGYAHVTMTVDGNVVKTYVDGVLGGTTSTDRLNISAADTLHFFLDNTAGFARTEYSGGTIALLRLYDGALDASEIAALAAGPLPPQGIVATTPVPLPGSLVLFGSSLVASLALRRRSS